MHDEAYYMVLYFGESLEFRKIMSLNATLRFLSWFQLCTHSCWLG